MFSFLQHASEIYKPNNHIRICIKGMNFKKKINNGEITVLAVM